MVLSVEIGMIILFSILGGVLAVRFRQPSVLGLLIIGAIVGPYSLGLIQDLSLIDTAIEIGAILLLFTIGIEFSLNHLFNYGLRAIIIASIKLGGVFLAGYLAALVLGLGAIAALYIGVILSITSTVVVIKILEQKGMSNKEEVPLLVTILILEDIFAVFALTFFSSLNTKADLSTVNLFTELIISLALMAVFFVVLKRLLRPVISWLIKYSTEDTITFTSLGLCAGMSYLAHLIHLSPSVGAFLAGNIVSSLPNSKMFEKSIHPFILTFTALFFFSVGTVVNFSVVLHSIYLIAALLAVSIFMKFFSIGFGSYLFSNFSGRQAIFSGIAMISAGEFSLLIAKEAEAAGLGLELVDITAALIVFSTIAMSFLINYSEPIYNFISRSMPSRVLEDVKLARNYINSVSWIMNKDRSSMKRISIEWKSILNNIMAVFFISAGGFIAWHFFRNIILELIKSPVIGYLLLGFFIIAIFFPAYNLTRKISFLFRDISVFFVKLYPKEIANEKKILRNFIAIGIVFGTLILLSNFILFLKLRPVYHSITIILICGGLIYALRASNLIHKLAQGHKSSMYRLSKKYKLVLRKKIMQARK
ncbi:MAG TPA: cation:proton antiporter [Candidatus Nanoarchaeia archaeon]|nr:cation:proton antiporter [Candidatus Nanoarchaeia archaeon]